MTVAARLRTSGTSALASRAASDVLGCIEPRLWTRPLVTGPPGPCGCGCALSPDTSMGFRHAAFARDTVRRPFAAHQEWLAIPAGELLPDGRPRFRKVIALMARQNGKTET